MRNYFPVSKCSGSGFPGVLDSKSKTWYATQFHTNTKNSQKSSPNNENCLVRSVHIPVKQTATCVLFPVSKDTLEIHPWFLSPFLWPWWRGSQQKKVTMCRTDLHLMNWCSRELCSHNFSPKECYANYL